MNNLLQSLKITMGCLLIMGNIGTAQVVDKPNLKFEVAINDAEQQLEITWNSCLENSIVKLLDTNLQPIKTQPLCKDKQGVIDISSLKNDLYYVQVEHYTGIGIQPVIKQLKDQAVVSAHEFKQVKSDTDILVYPNPAQNELTIRIQDLESEGVLTILNLEGKKVKNQVFNSNQMVLDISSLMQGIYFIRVEYDEKVGIQQVVKQ